MKRMGRSCRITGLSLIVVLMSGCTNEAGMELRDAAISGAATFVEQQTLGWLTSLLGENAVP